jgi:5'-nucleotidase
MFATKSLTHRTALAILLCASFVCLVSAQTKPTPATRITLLQLNDVYQLSPLDKGKSAGLARIAMLRKKVIAEQPNTLFLLAGDTISPSVASTIFKGRQMIAAWNALGLDFACLGNHEFDFGPEVLAERMKESKFTWLGANVIDRRTGKSFNGMPPYVIRKVGGVKVGVFGLLTTDTATSSKPGENIRFVDPILTARSVVRRMRARGVKIIVAVTHLTMSKDKELAATGLADVIIGGHEHELLASLAGRTPVFKWGQDARLLGRIDLNVNTRTGKLISMDWAGIPVTDATPDDPAAAAVIAEYENKVSLELDKPVGRTAVELDATTLANRTKETNLGNFIADAFRQATGAEVGLLNGGSVRVNKVFAVGELSKRDALAILPFENPVVKIAITGAVLRAALENGVSQVVEESESGRFPQVAGVQFEFDGRKPVGTRVVKVFVNGQPLEEKKSYTLAVTSYIAGGGDGYSMLKGAQQLIDSESAQIDSTVLANAISAVGEIAPKLEGRSKRLDQ